MIRSLSRGLDILSFLNRFSSATPVILAKELRVPRATVHRILETLADKGYIYKHPSDGEFRLTPKVRMLSSGYTDQAVIANLGRHLMEEVTEVLSWPVSFAAISGADLIIHENTDASSPLAVEKFKIGYRMPILESASGICILAFMSDGERDAILDMLGTFNYHGDQLMQQLTEVRLSIKNAFKIGYATHSRKRARFDISAIAVPVQMGDKVYGALTLRYHKPAVSEKDIIDIIVPMLSQTAREFSSLLDQHLEKQSLQLNDSIG